MALDGFQMQGSLTDYSFTRGAIWDLDFLLGLSGDMMDMSTLVYDWIRFDLLIESDRKLQSITRRQRLHWALNATLSRTAIPVEGSAGLQDW